MSQKSQAGTQKALAGRHEDGSFHGLAMIWKWFCKFKSHQLKYRYKELQAAMFVAATKPRVSVKRTLSKLQV